MYSVQHRPPPRRCNESFVFSLLQHILDLSFITMKFPTYKLMSFMFIIFMLRIAVNFFFFLVFFIHVGVPLKINQYLYNINNWIILNN